MMLAVAAEPGDIGSLRRIVEIGKAGVVELQLGTPQRSKRLDLVGVDLLQILPELFEVGVNRRINRGAPASVVHHAR